MEAGYFHVVILRLFYENQKSLSYLGWKVHSRGTAHSHRTACCYRKKIGQGQEEGWSPTITDWVFSYSPGLSLINPCPYVLPTTPSTGVSLPLSGLPAGTLTAPLLLDFSAWLHKPTKGENVNDSRIYSSWGSHEIFNISRLRKNPPGKIQSIFMLH